MSHFLKMSTGVDVSALRFELHQQPELWDQETTRRVYPNTPHAEMVDIWARYRSKDEIEGLDQHRSEHRNVMWPAWYRLPALRPLVFAMMTKVSAVELGSVLLTKLPNGGRILPHSDAGSWAPEYYNAKLHLIVAGQAIATCEEERVLFAQGDLYTFDNLKVHSVENHWPDDRIALIVSMRVE